MSKKASDKQKALLGKYGIVPPPTMRSCFHMITFIKGQGGYPSVFGTTESERIARVKEAQQRLIGKKITVNRDEFVGKVFTISYIVVEPSLNVIANMGIGDIFPGLFRVAVTDDRSKVVGLQFQSAITIVP